MDRLSTREVFSLEGKVAVITGGAGFLADVFGRALSDWGASVVLADIEVGRCEDRAANLAADGVAALALPCDVTDSAAWHQLLHDVIERFDRIDVLINCAGITNRSRTEGFDASFEGFPLADWRGILDVNLTGTFLGCQVVGAAMVERGGGSIVNIASQYAVVSPNHRIYDGTQIRQPVAYSVSKAGVLALTRYLGALWAASGVRVNSLTPGGIFDGQQGSVFLQRFQALNPMGRMGQSSELAGAVVYLSSDASSYCTGHNLIVDGGWTLW